MVDSEPTSETEQLANIDQAQTESIGTINLDSRRDNYYYLDDLTRIEPRIVPGQLACRFRDEILRLDYPDLWKQYVVLGPRRIAYSYRGETNDRQLETALDGPRAETEEEESNSRIFFDLWDEAFAKAKAVVEEQGEEIDREAYYSILSEFTSAEKSKRSLQPPNIPSHINRFLKLAHRIANKDINNLPDDRPEIQIMLRWIERNPEEFDMYLQAFDFGLEHYREMIERDDLDPMYANMHDLREKGLNNEEDYPALTKIVTEDPDVMKYFVSGLVRMNRAMRRGETDEEDDKLGFHQSQADVRARVIGGILHGYEEMLKRHGEFQAINVDQFINAYIEALGDSIMSVNASIKNDEYILPSKQAHMNMLLDALRKGHRLNWVLPFPEITDEYKDMLRKALGEYILEW